MKGEKMNTEIDKIQNKALLSLKYCNFRERKLDIDPNTPFDIFGEIGCLLGQMMEAHPFWVMDWMSFGEARYGEKYTQLLESTGLSYDYLRNLSSIKNHLSYRCDKLPFKHHALVAYMEPEDQKRFLDKAEKEGLSANELSACIKSDKRKVQKSGQVTCDKCGLPVTTALLSDKSSIVLDPRVRVYEVAQDVDDSFNAFPINNAMVEHRYLCVKPNAITIMGPVEKEMNFPIKGGTWILDRKKIAEWDNTYAGVNVTQEIKKARQWCIDNPSKRKTAKGMLKFINSWLSRSMDNTVTSVGKKYDGLEE